MPQRRRSLTRVLLAVCTAVAAGCASRDNPPDRQIPPETIEPASPADVVRQPAPFPVLPPIVAVPVPEVPATCPMVPEPGMPMATVGLTDPVDPAHAPRPSNASERLLFRQLYETLVRVDCDGRATPALAASWRLDGDGRTWVVSLREQARFDDGTFVTTGAVLASWSLPDGSGLRPAAGRLVSQATALDARTLAVVPRGAWGEHPLALAHPELAVAAPAGESRWPLGTRSARAIADPGAQAIVVQTGRLAPGPPDTTSGLRFLMTPGRDGRDLLDRGVDLLVTRDPATLAYAAALPRFERVPLAWDRTRVLIAPGRRAGAVLPAVEARHALATDAVRGEARGAEGPFWWDAPRACGEARPRPGPPVSTNRRVVYDEADGASRDLAERVVGLARTGSPASAAVLDGLPVGQAEPLRAVGLRGEALAQALGRGADAAYVLAVERRPLDACAALDGLLAAAPWLAPETIVPLVETRPQAIVGQGRAGAALEWDGTPLLAAPSPGR
jgi:hypothetical protein